jgi:hypothetical protein
MFICSNTYHAKKCLLLFLSIEKVSRYTRYHQDNRHIYLEEKGTLKAMEHDKYKNIAGSI